jgi:hypothetical protein
MIETRVAYRAGQRLDARDLGEDAGLEGALRAAHVRGVHRACGVACGFDIAVAADRRSVTVSPGLAYDAGGNELVVAEATTLRVPAWRPEGAGKPFEAGIELHVASGDSRARIRWTLAFAPTRGACGARPRRFLLATLAFDGDGSVFGSPRYAMRRVARTDRRPAVLTGTVAWNGLPWSGVGTSRWVNVDTSAAGFASTPIYFVRFASEPAPHGGVADLSLVLLSVDDPNPAGFKLNATYLAGDWRLELMTQHYRSAEIEWTAFESFAACSLHSTEGAL